MSRPSRIERIVMAPVTSGVITIAAAAYTLLRSDTTTLWWVTFSVALGAFWAFQGKARRMFKGQSATILPFFVLLQGLCVMDWGGCILAVVAVLSLLALFGIQNRRDDTRTIFALFLVPGVGLFFSPLWIGWAAILVLLTIVLRTYSLRGLVASILGLVTPAVALVPVASFFPSDPLFDFLDRAFAAYVAFHVYPPFAFDLSYFVAAAVCIICGTVNYFTAYGYTARPRERNMAVCAIAAGAALMACIDFYNLAFWLPVMNLCGAYMLGHVCATRRSGWAIALIVWTLLAIVPCI